MTVRALKKKFSKEEIAKLSEEILALKEEKNSVILAHYYQELEIQDVGDIIGDSLGLSQAARDVEEADFIVFAGVHFYNGVTAAIWPPAH